MNFDLWQNSSELRGAVEFELDNWGAWHKNGGRVDLGYPHQIPGATPPEHDPPKAVIEKLARATEHVISTWCATSKPGQRGAFLLKLKYIEQRPLEKIRHDFNRKFRREFSDSTVAALIDEAEFFYWMLTS